MLEVVNFSGRRATENLQLQLDCVVVGVYIEIGRDVELLSSLSIDVFLIMLLKILVLIQNAPCDNIDHDVGFAYIDQHVIFKDNGMFLTDKDTIAYAKIFYLVIHVVEVVANLEMLSSMSLCSLLVLIRNDKVVDHFFNCGCFLVKIGLMGFYAFFAAKIDEAITKILLSICHTSKMEPLSIIVCLWVSNILHLHESSLRFVTHET